MDGALPRSIDTVVIGAGQAGLLMSWHLQQAGRTHVVLDRRETLGGGWQDRWDGFVLVGPNWTTGLPGFPTRTAIPMASCPATPSPPGCGGMPTSSAARSIAASTAVSASRPTAPAGAGSASRRRGPIDADDVIVATGAFHDPRSPPPPPASRHASLQLHSHDYRNPGQLPPGGVLIVGSGQTGVQLAEELHEAGRAVALSVGRCGRAPRRYRGHDVFWWFRQLATRGPDFGVAAPVGRPSSPNHG